MTDSPELAIKIARIAMPEMSQYRIPPTPQNYAVWYLYATGRNKKLVLDINALKEDDADFTTDLNRRLYDVHVAPSTQGVQLQEHNQIAQGLMRDLVELVGVMTSETNAYNQQLDGYIEGLSGKYQDIDVRRMVESLAEKTRDIRSSGGELSAKLEESKREVEELRVNLEKISTEAKLDGLTGIANRKAFDMGIIKAVEDAKHGLMHVSLLMIDIDHFKKFNDQYGHLVGDEVLKIVAKELVKSVRGRDVVARFGGEEFAILLLETSLLGALQVAESLCKSIGTRDITRKDTKEHIGHITISVGVAQFKSPNDTVESFIKRADDALYLSKKNGRNRVTQESI